MDGVRGTVPTALFSSLASDDLVAADDESPPRPPKVLSQTSAIEFLLKLGWTRDVGGKHQVKMVKKGCRPITLPEHKGRDYSPGLRAAILREVRTGEGSEGNVDL